MYVDEVEIRKDALQFTKQDIENEHTGEAKDFKKQFMSAVVEQVALGADTVVFTCKVPDRLKQVIFDIYKTWLDQMVHDHVTQQFYSELPKVE